MLQHGDEHANTPVFNAAVAHAQRGNALVGGGRRVKEVALIHEHDAPLSPTLGSEKGPQYASLPDIQCTRLVSLHGKTAHTVGTRAFG